MYIYIYMGFLKMEDPKKPWVFIPKCFNDLDDLGGTPMETSTVRIANVHVNGADWPAVVKYFQGLCGTLW
jgi:hypothetical protein